MDVPNTLLTLQISSAANKIGAERRFAADMTVSRLRDALYPITGTAPALQLLAVCDDARKSEVPMRDDSATLWAAGCRDGLRIHVGDAAPAAAAALTDVSQVEK